ncbi:MAG: tyrosine-type recombinase/integrase, partial [Alphaproteobacteria bacterium]|nr:tyrosine-type recombinase/integrase [Alphaproteobacteria bacterium]
MSDDAALIGRFLEMMGAERGASQNTLDAYRRDLTATSAALGGRLGMAKADMLASLGALWAGHKRTTVARKASALRHFFAFLEEEGLRTDNPAHALPRVGGAQHLPKMINQAEVVLLFDEIARRLAEVPPQPNAFRLAALIELLYGSGLRASELVALDLFAIAPDRSFAIIIGKGDKERMVPVSDRARAAVAAWRTHRPGSSKYLVPGGKAHLSRVRLFQEVKSLALAVGIDPARISPHVL